MVPFGFLFEYMYDYDYNVPIPGSEEDPMLKYMYARRVAKENWI